MAEAFDLNTLLAGTQAAGTALDVLDRQPVSATAQRVQSLDTAYDKIGDSNSATALAIGEHNAALARDMASVGAAQASRSAVAAVELADQLGKATEQVQALRSTAESANSQLQPLLEQRNALSANFPGWGNPLARISAAYKVSRLDEQIAGLQQNAAAAVDAANSLASTQAATIREHSQAEQLKINSDYAERVALVKQQYAGQAESLNSLNAANAAATAEANQRLNLTNISSTNALQGEELKLRKSEAARRNAAEDAAKAQVDTLARQVLRARGVTAPSNDDLNGARVLVTSIDDSGRAALSRLVITPGAEVNNGKYVLNSLANSGASLANMRKIGNVLGLTDVSNIGAPLFESERTAALLSLRTQAFNAATTTVKDQPGARFLNNVAISEGQWWSSLQPKERKELEDKAAAIAQVALETNDITSLNATVYSKIGPGNKFSLTPNTAADVQRVFGVPQGSVESAVLLDPHTRNMFEAAASRDPSMAGPLQFATLYDEFKRAGSKDPAAAVSKVVTAFARGAAGATQDGAWLRDVGIDLPALYVVPDSHGNPRNLANPLEVTKFMQLRDNAKKAAGKPGMFSAESLAMFGGGAGGQIASLVGGVGATAAIAGGNGAATASSSSAVDSTAGGKAGGKATTSGATAAKPAPEKRVQNPQVAFMKRLAEAGTSGALTGTMDVSGERSAAELSKLNTPEAIAARAAASSPQQSSAPQPAGRPGESYGLRAVLEARARENTLKIQQLKEADAAARREQASGAASTPAPDGTGVALRDFIRGDVAAREEAIAAKGGATGPASTASIVGPSLAEDVANRVVQLQRTPDPAAKEQSFLKLVQELYAKAFGHGGDGAYIPQTPTAQQQAEAAAEYNRNGGR